MRYTLFILAILIFAACNKNKVFEKHHSLKDNTWDKTNIITFEVDIKEIGIYDIKVAVRHATYYPYANVIVALTTETPDGESRHLQKNLIIRNEDGSFKGDVLGDISDISIPIYEAIEFKEKGTYVFTLENRMHLTEIKGIMKMGLIINKSNS